MQWGARLNLECETSMEELDARFPFVESYKAVFD